MFVSHSPNFIYFFLQPLNNKFFLALGLKNLKIVWFLLRHPLSFEDTLRYPKYKIEIVVLLVYLKEKVSSEIMFLTDAGILF